jgi:predicted dehydrogenase
VTETTSPISAPAPSPAAAALAGTSPIKKVVPVGVVGCGRMGRLHARVYSQMPHVKLMGVYDADHDKAKATAEEFGTQWFPNLKQLLPMVAGCSVAVPTKYHADLAEPFLRRGVAVLIEKPLAKDVFDARKIVEASHQYTAIVQVGHIERFNPAIVAMQRLDVRPRFIEVVRISPLTFRSIDVGVVLDMMIHDIDIVLRLANSRVSKIDATGVSVIGEVEDICNARLTFENGCVANLTASRLSLKTERKLRVFSQDAYVSIDYQKKVGVVARRSGNVEKIRQTVQQIRRGEIDDITQLDFADLVQVEELQIDDIEPLRAELESFVDAVANKKRPAVTAEEGLAAVEVASHVVEAIKGQTL